MISELLKMRLKIVSHLPDADILFTEGYSGRRLGRV